MLAENRETLRSVIPEPLFIPQMVKFRGCYIFNLLKKVFWKNLKVWLGGRVLFPSDKLPFHWIPSELFNRIIRYHSHTSILLSFCKCASDRWMLYMTGESGGFLQVSFFSKLFIGRVQPQDSTNAFVSKWFVPAPIQIKHLICAFCCKQMCTCLLSSNIPYFINMRDLYFFYYIVRWMAKVVVK